MVQQYLSKDKQFTPENISEVVRKAFKVAETEKPGLTVIELPEDIAEEEIDEKPINQFLLDVQLLITEQLKTH